MRRREFLAGAAAFAVGSQGFAQVGASVVEMERAHVMAEAKTALGRPKRAATTGYFEALPQAAADIAALIAAYVLTKEGAYAESAVGMLEERVLAVPVEDPLKERADGVIRWLPLAEIARATSFLVDTESFSNESQKGAASVFEGTLQWLNSKRAERGRDAKNHEGSAWLLLSSALARATRDEKQMGENRARFKKPTLRTQIDLSGRFPQEAASSDPLRNTLMNFDLLCGCAQVLSTPFENLWEFELVEGLSLRSAASYLYPFLADVRKWPLPADSAHFRDVPLRRPGLLLAGRAYHRPEYVSLFASLPVVAVPEAIGYSVPIRQPLLWTTKAPHGL